MWGWRTYNILSSKLINVCFAIVYWKWLKKNSWALCSIHWVPFYKWHLLRVQSGPNPPRLADLKVKKDVYTVCANSITSSTSNGWQPDPKSALRDNMHRRPHAWRVSTASSHEKKKAMRHVKWTLVLVKIQPVKVSKKRERESKAQSPGLWIIGLWR